MKYKTILAILMTLLIVSCVPVQQPKADDTGFTNEGVSAVVKANNDFAFDLYSELSNHL